MKTDLIIGQEYFITRTDPWGFSITKEKLVSIKRQGSDGMGTHVQFDNHHFSVYGRRVSTENITHQYRGHEGLLCSRGVHLTEKAARAWFKSFLAPVRKVWRSEIRVAQASIRRLQAKIKQPYVRVRL